MENLNLNAENGLKDPNNNTLVNYNLEGKGENITKMVF